MFYKIASVGVLFMFSSVTNAEPTVSGNTISWPDDGWYQVQRVQGTTVTEVCSSGRSCVVEPGEYIVINHSKSQRFEGIVVKGASADTEISPTIDQLESSPVFVDLDTIKVPRGTGWYQVQSAGDYKEFCNGVYACTVPPGIYNVINHSDGMRYGGIEIKREPKIIANDIRSVDLVLDTMDDFYWMAKTYYMDNVAGVTLFSGEKQLLVEDCPAGGRITVNFRNRSFNTNTFGVIDNDNNKRTIAYTAENCASDSFVFSGSGVFEDDISYTYGEIISDDIPGSLKITLSEGQVTNLNSGVVMRVSKIDKLSGISLTKAFSTAYQLLNTSGRKWQSTRVIYFGRHVTIYDGTLDKQYSIENMYYNAGNTYDRPGVKTVQLTMKRFSVPNLLARDVDLSAEYKVSYSNKLERVLTDFDLGYSRVANNGDIAISSSSARLPLTATYWYEDLQVGEIVGTTGFSLALRVVDRLLSTDN